MKLVVAILFSFLALARVDAQHRFTNDQVKVGDCVGKLNITLQPDGTGAGNVISYTKSTHSGDYLRLNFDFKDADGVRVAWAKNANPHEVHEEVYRKFPASNTIVHWQFSSPRMNDEDGHGNRSPRYRWAFKFTFDKDAYPSITSCVFHYGG